MYRFRRRLSSSSCANSFPESSCLSFSFMVDVPSITELTTKLSRAVGVGYSGLLAVLYEIDLVRYGVGVCVDVVYKAHVLSKHFVKGLH